MRQTIKSDPAKRISDYDVATLLGSSVEIIRRIYGQMFRSEVVERVGLALRDD